MYSREAALENEGQVASLDFDSQLIERLKAGDEVAFELLFNCYHEMVYRVAYRLLGERDEALDLTQEVFLAIYRKIGSFGARASLKTWIYRIVLNAAANRQRWWRNHRRSYTISLENPPPDGDARRMLERLQAQSPSPYDKVCEHELEEQIARALRELPFEQRAAVTMRDIEGLSYEDIATATGASLGTVKSRIARGREGLRKRLQGYLNYDRGPKYDLPPHI